MTESDFWDLVNRTLEGWDPSGCEGNFDRQEKSLRAILGSMSEEEIVEFDLIFHDLLVAAYRSDLWDVADVLIGSATDDDFVDFRCWLISRGKAVYEATLSDPLSLADEADRKDIEDLLFMEFGTAAGDVFEEKTQREIEPYSNYPEAPVGSRTAWDHLAEKYPDLWARFQEK